MDSTRYDCVLPAELSSFHPLNLLLAPLPVDLYMYVHTYMYTEDLSTCVCTYIIRYVQILSLNKATVDMYVYMYACTYIWIRIARHFSTQSLHVASIGLAATYVYRSKLAQTTGQ